MKKNIAILIENYAAGGADKIARNLVDYLSYNKLYLFVNKSNDMSVLLDKPLPENAELILYEDKFSTATIAKWANDFKKKNKLLYFFAKSINLVLRYFLLIYSIFYFYNLFKKYDFEIFISNNGGYPGGGNNRTSALAITLLRSNAMNYYIYMIIHSIASPEKFPPYKPVEYLFDCLIDRICKIIVVSDETGKALLKARNFKQQPLIFYNGILDSAFKAKKINNDELKLLNIGILYSVKNQLKLLEAFALARMQGATNCSLYLLGKEGEERYLDKLKAFIDSHNLQGVVHLQGFCNPQAYYESCDILVHTALYESFVLARVEAMSASMPIISTNVGSADVQIENGVNGFIADSIEEIASKILFYYHNREQILIHGQRGREIFLDKFRLESMIEKYQKLIDSCYVEQSKTTRDTSLTAQYDNKDMARHAEH